MPQVAAFFPVTFATAGTTITASMVVTQLLSSVALSALSQAILKPDAPRPPGIATEVTTTGGTNPQSFVLGRYATAGNEVAPPMSHGEVDGTPNAYLTYVHDLGDMPITALHRIVLNDDYNAFGQQPGDTSYTAHPDYGEIIRGKYYDWGWIKFYDGTQTTADAMLTSKYGSYPDRPWASDMIGRGVPYVIATFRYRRDLYNALPRLRYEVDGIALYDPRKDTTVGGSGAHRWSDTSTWEFTRNPIVMIYNILRGITLPDGRVWGGECAADDLPLANWFAAMNVCDEAVSLSAGGTEPRYRAGLEVRVADEPGSVIEELLKACSGQIVESGGVYRVRAGGVGLPVLSITDDDVIVTEAQSFVPFTPLAETYNAVHASYPEPEALYAATDAPPRYNATYESEDQGRQLVADLGLPAVPYGRQVQRLTDAWIKEERRLRRHRLTLPPKAAKVEPLDAIAWSSTANGYTGKVFEVSAAADSFLTLNQGMLIRERDSGDYSWSSGDEVAVVVPDFGIVEPSAQSVVGLSVTAVAIEDATGTSRRPAIRFGWTTLNIDDVDGVQFEVRVQATGEMVSQPSTMDFASGNLVTEAGLVGNTAYEVRARYIVSGRRSVDWTSWTTVTTLAVFLQDGDFENGIYSLFRDQGLYAIRDVTALPASGVFTGEKVFNRTDGKLYQWTGTAWQLVVADVAAGSITETKIGPNAVTTPKLAAGAVTAAEIAAGSITGDRIQANTITGGLLATSGIITSSAQIGTGLITAAKIGTAEVTSTKIATAAITTAKIGTAQVDTIRIGNDAVTVQRATYASVQLTGTTEVVIDNLNWTAAYGGDVAFFAVVEIQTGNIVGSSAGNVRYLRKVNGATSWSVYRDFDVPAVPANSAQIMPLVPSFWGTSASLQGFEVRATRTGTDIFTVVVWIIALERFR